MFGDVFRIGSITLVTPAKLFIVPMFIKTA